LDALDYLAKPDSHPAARVCVLFGDESFLKRHVLADLKERALSGADADFSVSNFRGDDIAMRDVADALAERALFGGGRHLVVVEEADGFVSKNRPALEDYVARPHKQSILVLEVTQWAASTRLYKALVESGLQIECKFPPPARAAKWIVHWSHRRHGVKLEPAAAELLLETVEPELGLIDQELAKLAALAGSGGTVTTALVHEAVGGWRAKTAWDMLDAALAGDATTALVELDRLLVGGDVPIALLAQISSNLRRLAAATRLVEQASESRGGDTLRRALEEVGVKPYFLSKTEEQLRRLGRIRGSQLYRWLLGADLALKGVSSSPAKARLVLEILIARLAAPQAPTTRPATALRR
jgi:DNA polymerase-3 subunit delta